MFQFLKSNRKTQQKRIAIVVAAALCALAFVNLM
jgi:hypothetical protein